MERLDALASIPLAPADMMGACACVCACPGIQPPPPPRVFFFPFLFRPFFEHTAHTHTHTRPCLHPPTHVLNARNNRAGQDGHRDAGAHVRGGRGRHALPRGGPAALLHGEKKTGRGGSMRVHTHLLNVLILMLLSSSACRHGARLNLICTHTHLYKQPPNPTKPPTPPTQPPGRPAGPLLRSEPLGVRPAPRRRDRHGLPAPSALAPRVGGRVPGDGRGEFHCLGNGGRGVFRVCVCMCVFMLPATPPPPKPYILTTPDHHNHTHSHRSSWSRTSATRCWAQSRPSPRRRSTASPTARRTGASVVLRFSLLFLCFSNVLGALGTFRGWLAGCIGDGYIHSCG